MAHPYESLFALPSMVRNLMHGYILRDTPDADSLDYERMTRVPDNWVPEGPRYADLVWCIPFRLETEDVPPGPTHLIVVLKFVDEVVEDIGERLSRHASSLQREVVRRRAFGAPDTPPVVAPIVVYNGPEPWDAPGGVRV